jgi:hypothetical protein
MKNIKIASHHQSLAAAVEAANIDLSYNPELAKRDIRDTDLNCHRAFVTEDGEVYYVYSADIELLNKYTPFVSVLCDSPFQVAFVVGDTLAISETFIPKSQRSWFKRNQLGALAA